MATSDNLLSIPIKLVFGNISDELKEKLGNLVEKFKGLLSSATHEAFVKALDETKQNADASDTAHETGRGNKGRQTGPENKDPNTDTSGEKDTDKKEGDGKKNIFERMKEKMKEEGGAAKVASIATHKSANLINTSLKKGFGIVEDIYSRLKSASPLLQAIESMFNLAMQLFFMPLGNKLAEVLIPSVLQLVDDVVGIWGSFEGKTLGEMFDFAIKSAVKLFGGFFENIGDKLIEQGGLIARVGTFIQSIGDFITTSGATLLESILNVSTFLVSNFKHFVSLWFGLKTAEIAIQGLGPLGITGTNAAIAVAALTSASFLASEVGLSVAGFAEGGYVPAKPGGQLAVISEGGEGEYIVPESKLQSFVESHGGNRYSYSLDSRSTRNDTTNIEDSQSSKIVNITYHINGYTDSELKTIIRETMDEQVAKSSYRS